MALFQPGLQKSDDGMLENLNLGLFYLINAVYADGPEPVSSGDADGNGQVNEKDVEYLTKYFLAGGPAPAGRKARSAK